MRRFAPLFLFLPCSALAVPMSFSHQGRLLDSAGTPLDGAHDVTFALYDAATGGSPIWTETQSLELEGGYYSASLGASTALDAGLFDGDALWLALAVDGGGELDARLPLASVPYAVRAGDATNLSGGVVDATEIRVNGLTVIDGSGALRVDDTLSALGCAAGEIPVSDGSSWSCGDARAHVHDAADIGTGTLTIDRIPVGTDGESVAAGDHDHDAADTVSGTFPADRLPVGTAADQVAAGDHGHSAADVGALPIGGGTVDGDVTVKGALVVEGVSFPYNGIIAGRRWNDSAFVTWDRANQKFNQAGAYVDVGASFPAGGIPYARIPLLPKGAVASKARVSLEIEWVRDCNTGDCDTNFRITDGSGAWVGLGTYDNDGGTIDPMASTGDAPAATSVGANPNHVVANFLIGGSTASVVTWTVTATGAGARGSGELAAILDPATGLDLVIVGHDAPESYRHRLVKFSIEPL